MARDVPAGGQKRLLVTDVVVPISRFSDILGETKRDFGATKHKLQFIVVGHAIGTSGHATPGRRPACAAHRMHGRWD
jgi:hypothetical protein